MTDQIAPLYSWREVKEDSDRAMQPHRDRRKRAERWCEATYTVISMMLFVAWAGLGLTVGV